MLVSMKAILDDANENNYGVMAMNSINMEMARAGIMAAEEEHSAIIIQFGNGQMNQPCTSGRDGSDDQRISCKSTCAGSFKLRSRR